MTVSGVLVAAAEAGITVAAAVIFGVETVLLTKCVMDIFLRGRWDLVALVTLVSAGVH